MNSVLPYLGEKTALIGMNTFGKPVGSSLSVDRAQCDDRLSLINFATQNADKQGDYFDGLASRFKATCSATDDISRSLGDPQEAMVKSALDFLAGRPCPSPISGGGITAQKAGKVAVGQLITPAAPNTAQGEVPGFF
jgi:hypothetical protein